MATWIWLNMTLGILAFGAIGVNEQAMAGLDAAENLVAERRVEPAFAVQRLHGPRGRLEVAQLGRRRAARIEIALRAALLGRDELGAAADAAPPASPRIR